MNFNYEIEKINPINISDAEYSANKIPNNVRKSIALYNRAIANLKANCADLAISDLKRSLSLNSSFCEAIKLLGLCYVYNNDFNKAESVFRKLSKYTIYNTLAKDYLRQLNVERTTSKALNVIENASSKSDKKMKVGTIFKLPRQTGRIKKFVVVFLVLAIITAVSGLVYRSRSNIQTMFNKAKNTELKKNKELQQEKVTNEKQAEVDKDYKKNQENLENAKLALNNYKDKNNIILKLDDAEKLYNNGDHEKAVDDLLALKGLKLDDMEKSRFDKLWNDIKTHDVWNIYNQASKLYKQDKYQEALPKLIKVQELAPELQIMPWVMYQTGMCYKETNDNKNALILFQKVKSNYPNSEYASYSEGMISEISSNGN